MTNQVTEHVGHGSARPRSAAEIAADLDRTRERLAGDVTLLRDYFAPASIARRGSERVTGWFLDDFGGVRVGRVAVVVGPLLLTGLGLGLARRRR